MTTTTSSTQSSGGDKPFSSTWFRRIVDRAIELLVEEDTRLEGIGFEIAEASVEEVLLIPTGSCEVLEALPAAPAVFRTFIRRAAEEHGPREVIEELRDDRHWPLLGYIEKSDSVQDVSAENDLEDVVHPSYYNLGGIEVWDATDEWGLGKGFNRGSAIKYIARAGFKPGADELRDLVKAREFLDHEIERVKRERSRKDTAT